MFKAAPEEAAAPAPPAPGATAAPAATAEDECLPRPGKSTTDGQRWVYRLDGHRKCWFQTAKEVGTSKKPVHHHAAKQPVAAPEEDEAAPPKKAVVDARAEVLRSAPAETPQPTPPTPEVKLVDAAAVPGTAAAALVPPAPVVAQPETDQLTPDQLAPNHPTPPQVDVDTLLAAASDAAGVSSAVPVAEDGDDGPGWTASWLGVLLMGLGLVSLLISSWTLRGNFAFGPNK